jgi:CYTH domain-containing protein
MATETEFERRYLPRNLPTGIEQCKVDLIQDVALPEGVAFPHLRLRQVGGNYVITKKVPVDEDSSRHQEDTIRLTKDEFEALAKGNSRGFVKSRYYCNIEGYDAEIDVYQDGLEGLVVIEFEFNDASSMAAFQTPELCLAEITDDKRLQGGSLAGKSFEDIEPVLNEYSYARIALNSLKRKDAV